MLGRLSNIYFDLTREFNRDSPVAALASGQAVVYYRLALASKDGDWIVRESEAACHRVLEVLAAHGATYRLSAPLDLRWLRGGWSSHFEFFVEGRRRVRCDFFSRAPRVPLADIESLFRDASGPLLVVGLEPLIQMKRTQRAKDYPIIAELARLLPPEREIELTTEADRILELARGFGGASARPCVRAARERAEAELVELELVREIRRDRLQDQERVRRYARAAGPYLAEFLSAGIDRLALPEAHLHACELAARCLPAEPADDRG
jgi:hypothetical protein